MANLRPKVLNANGYDELLDDGDNIQLVAAPATDDAAANKEYVDTVAESLQGEIDSIVNPGGDPAYVRKAGDNMTGDLTLGTDKISLNASDGSASCASGNVELKNFSTDYGAVAIRNTSGNQFYLTYAESDVLGLTARSATIADQTQPIKFNGDTGAATFSSSRLNLNAHGDGASLDIRRDSNTPVFKIFNGGFTTDDTKVEFLASGSATFAATVQVAWFCLWHNSYRGRCFP